MTNYTKLEEELNNIKYNGVGVGSLLAFELFLLSSKTYKKKSLKGYLVFIKIALRAIITSIPIFKNKKGLYYKSGDKNHYNQIYSSFKQIEEDLILTGATKGAMISSYSFYINWKYFRYLIRWGFNNYKNFKIILNKNLIHKNEFSLFIDLIINLFRINFWDDFFNKNKVQFLVGDYDRGNISVPIFLTAKKHKVPSVVIQHGVINPPYGYTPLIADTVFVWGEMQKKQYIALGVKKERIIVTGTPIVSKIINQKKENLNKKIVLAVNPIKKEYVQEQIDEFIKLNKLNQYKLFVKVHPSQTIEVIEKMINDNNVKIFSKEIEFSDFVKKCDVLVTHNSGLANECILNDIPVIILDNLPISAGNGLELNTFCNVPLVNNMDELNEQIKNSDTISIRKNNLYYKTGLEAKKEIQKQFFKLAK